jgi:hypothetical protein
VNKNKNPKTQKPKTVIFPPLPNKLIVQLKILIPVGTAITIVAPIK